MGPGVGDALLVGLPGLILLAVLWGVSVALKPRDHGLSDAERYQKELAVRSAAHHAAQVQAAMEARARINASTKPSQNEQQAAQQTHILPSGQLTPQLVLQLQAMVRSGQKIEAIKLLRRATHADLSSAKNYIDRL